MLNLGWLLEHIVGHLGELRLAAALLAAAVAFLAILSHRRTTARKTTLDFILKHELHDPIWLALRLKVRPILKDPAKWGAIVEAESTPDKQDVLAWLNHHEIVAVGVKHRALDGTLYFDWLGSLYRADWDLAHSFVRTLREHEEATLSSDGTHQRSRAFVEFEKLATSKKRRIGLATTALRILDYVVYAMAAIVALLAGLLIVI